MPYRYCSYCVFFSGSWLGVLLELLELGEVADGEAELESLLPDVPLLEDPLVAPPEAEPELDFEASFDGSVALEELEEPEGLVDGLVELPPEGEVVDEELEPEEGEVACALLLLPLVLPPGLVEGCLSWPQAARPSAKATATARVESLMNPPWLG